MKQSVAKVFFVCIFVVAVLTVAAAGLISCGGEKGALSKIEIFPDNPSIAKGYSHQLYGAGTLSNGVIYTMTILSWSSSNPEVATVSDSGLVTAVSKGSTTITATEIDSNMNLSDTTTVMVEDIQSIAVTPVEPSMAVSTAYQFVSTATFTPSGATQNLTASLTWTTSDAVIASVVDTPGTSGNGIVTTGTAAGSTTITATDLISTPTLSGTTTLTVTSTPLTSLAITPADIGMTSGPTSSQQFTATGTYADGTSQELTSSMTWTTSDAAIASIVDKPGTIHNGLVTAGTATGTTTITATDPITTKTGSTTLTVN